MKKLLALILSLTLVMTSLVGCSKKEEAAKEEVKQEIKYNIGSDPKTLDPALNAEVQAATMLVNMYEGLMKTDKDGKIIPGMAEKHEVSDNGLTYTFHLRDAKWSDGQPVKAQDFEYAWKRALDPKTAAEYAYQLYYLKNGEKFNGGKATADEVGVKATDDKTLVVTLEYSAPYFIDLMTFPTYFPVRKDIVEKNPEAWANDPSKSVFNGPFKGVKWERNNVVRLEKNDNYYQKDKIKLSAIEFVMITEATTAYTAFKSGEIDGTDEVPTAQLPKLMKEKDPNFKNQPYLGIYYFSFNITKKPLDNPKVRRALSIAMDRQAIVDVVTKGGQLPATSFVPPGIMSPDGKDFMKDAKDYGIKPTAQIEEAKKLLAEAGFPDGKGFPKLTFIYNTNEAHKAIAEAVQEMWKKNLGIEIQLNNQEWKVFQETREKGDFEIARDGWIADYADPMTFLDMHISASGNNHSQFKNPEYDKLITDSKSTLDAKKRYELMHKAEDTILDNSIVAPIYYYTNPEILRAEIKDVNYSPLGFVYFNDAHVEAK